MPVIAPLFRLFSLGLLLFAATTSWAVETPEKTKEDPLPVMEADTLSFDEKTNIITALGHVQVAFGDKMLRADKMTYNKGTSIVTATGNVAMMETSGTTLFADEMEVTSDLKQGFIDKVGVLFPDNSRLVALDAQRYVGRYLIADHGVYSSCNLCKDDPTKPPLWQLKGTRITHDSEKKDIIYRDAVLEFSGVPVFYVPYFSHPDSTVERRQGFLTPSGGIETNLGMFARTPYYFDLAPNSDLVVTPTLSSAEGAQLQTTWRHAFNSGQMKWSGSFTRADFVNESGEDEGKKWRGHIFGNTNFDLDNNWRLGSDVAYTSDKSYLSLYDISDEDIMVNRAYAEYFKGRNYGVANAYYFQDLRPGDQLAEPIVLPELRYSAVGEPNRTLGGRWSFDSGLLVTTRDRGVSEDQQGPSTRRLSLNMGWERQYASNTGFLTKLSGLVRSDSYWAENVPDPDLALGTSFSTVTRTRPFAQGDLSLRYPLGRHTQNYQQILEPIVALSAAPNVSKSELYPNEDSEDLEFDETNLFAENRFTGLDKVEGGTRMAFGLRHAIIGNNGARIEMVGGQVFRLHRDTTLPEDSGLQERMSDYVGRVDIVPADWLTLNYGFRLDQNDLDFSRQELATSFGTNMFRPHFNFLSVARTDSTTNTLEQVEEITAGFSSNFTTYWNFSASHTQALNPSPGARATQTSLTYQDECFSTGVTFKKEYTDRLDLEAGTSVLFQFYLKNIGGFSTR